MQIKIKKLDENAIVPQKAHENDAGFDLTATSKKMGPEGYLEYGTGLAISVPESHVGLLFPRSSISKKGLCLSNAVGVLDEGYLGEVTFRFKPANAGRGIYEVGERIGQLVVMPISKLDIVEVDELDETERGEGGYGSSGE